MSVHLQNDGIGHSQPIVRKYPVSRPGLARRVFKRSKERARCLTEGVNFLVTRKSPACYVGCVGQGNLGDEVLYDAVSSLFSGAIRFYTANRTSGILKALNLNGDNPPVFLGGGTLIKKSSGYLKRVSSFLESYPRAKFIVFGTGVADAELWDHFGIMTDKENRNHV